VVWEGEAARPTPPDFLRTLWRKCKQIARVIWYGIARGRKGGLQEAGLLEMLTIQPARIMIGATVFTGLLGVLRIVVSMLTIHACTKTDSVAIHFR
jgi:hypothetical protein